MATLQKKPLYRKALAKPAAAITLAVLASHAFAASPRFVFDPIEDQARACVSLGSTWNAKVVATLRLARANTARLLPSTAWDEVSAALHTGGASGAAHAEPSRCETFVATYSDPKLSNRIRARVLAGFLVQSYAGCAAEFPATAAATRAAWIAAFARNDLDPMTATFDDAVRTSWRKPSDDAEQRRECDVSMRMLESKEFDQVASESSVRRMLFP